MTRTQKNLKTAYVKSIGKIGRALVADLAYIFIHHFKSICQTLSLLFPPRFQAVRKVLLAREIANFNLSLFKSFLSFERKVFL